MNYKIELVDDRNGNKDFKDLRLTFEGTRRRFILVPLTTSKREKAYFYALLKGEAKHL